MWNVAVGRWIIFGSAALTTWCHSLPELPKIWDRAGGILGCFFGSLWQTLIWEELLSQTGISMDIWGFEAALGGSRLMWNVGFYIFFLINALFGMAGSRHRGERLVCRNFIPKNPPRTAFPVRKFPWASGWARGAVEGECGGCSAGIWDPRILGREMITKWSWCCLSPVLPAQITGACWFSLDI